MTGCHNIHAVLHGAFRRSLLYCYTNSTVNFTHQNVAIWFCCDALLETRSSVSSASARFSQRTWQLGCDSLTQGVTEASRSSDNKTSHYAQVRPEDKPTNDNRKRTQQAVFGNMATVGL